MRAISLLGVNDLVAKAHPWLTATICPFNKREDSRI